MKEGKLVNHTYYSQELVLESYRVFLKVKHRLRHLVSLCLAALLILSSAGVLADMVRGLQPFNYNYVVFVLVALGLIWTVFGGYTSVARRTYNGMAQSRTPLDMNYSFNENGFNVQTTEDTFDIQWRQCLFSVYSEKVCAIAVNKKFYAVDLQSFSEGSAEDFLDLVKRKTEVRNVKWI